MDLSTATLLAGFVVSTVGFSLAVYGRRQRRAPQWIAGLALMAAAWVVPGAWLPTVVAGAIVTALVLAVRAGW